MKFPVRLFLIFFCLTYYIAERTGIFGVTPESTLHVLFSMPFLSASVLFLIVTLLEAITHLKSMKTADWLSVLSILLLVSGLWISYLTRFSGNVVLTEGQTFYSGHDDYVRDTFYRGRFSRAPDSGMELLTITPAFNDDRSRLLGLTSTFKPVSREGNKEDITITDGLPTIIEGSFFSVRDFGYSLRYELKSREGRVLDSSFVYMNLFPPGSEDSFRLLSPLTYYIRYFPEGREDIKEPIIGLRIVRNKDIVFNSHVKKSEDASFENSIISFEDVRMWTKLTIVHDWGMVSALCGILIGLTGFLFRIIKR